MKKITVSPLTRVHGPATVEVMVENKRVVSARCISDFFRGFEIIMRGRDPRDAPYLTGRICGICPSGHGTAASMALENAAGVLPPLNGVLLRSLTLGAEIIQNHIRQFYLFSMPDYVRTPKIGPLSPGYSTDLRFTKKDNERIVNNYFEAIEVSRIANEIITTFGGKTPFSHGLLAGGSTVPPTTDIVMNVGFKLKKIKEFIKTRMIPDLHTLSETYSDYYKIGCRKTNLLTYGLFPKDQRDTERYFPAASVIEGNMEELDVSLVREHASNAWYTGDSMPGRTRPGKSEPDREKKDAYSWNKAPRYRGKALEGGPLARLWVRGDYRKGISTMDRTAARVLETEKICKLMEEWLQQLHPDKPVFNSFKVPGEAAGTGLTDAMRGPLGHWLTIKDGRVANYDIVTPTAWNFSPRDNDGKPGPMEEALVGTPVENEEEAVEVGRVIRSFDPCSTCSAHVMVPSKPVQSFVIMP